MQTDTQEISQEAARAMLAALRGAEAYFACRVLPEGVSYGPDAPRGAVSRKSAAGKPLARRLDAIRAAIAIAEAR